MASFNNFAIAFILFALVYDAKVEECNDKTLKALFSVLFRLFKTFILLYVIYSFVMWFVNLI